MSVVLMIKSSSESESVSACLGGLTGGGGSTASPVLVLVSSVVSPLFPLCINVRRGIGVPVTRIGLLLRVFAETGVLSSDIQLQLRIDIGCIGARRSSEVFGCYTAEVLVIYVNLLVMLQVTYWFVQ